MLQSSTKNVCMSMYKSMYEKKSIGCYNGLYVGNDRGG